LYNPDEEGFHFFSKFFNGTHHKTTHIIHSPKANASEQMDLLYAATFKDVTQITDGVVNLNFAHLLSKVVFYAKVTDEHLLVQIDEVKVCNVYTKGKYIISKGTDYNYDNHTVDSPSSGFLTQLDNLNAKWYANNSPVYPDTQHSGQGAYAYTTGTISPMVSVSTASGALSISDETNTADDHTNSENIAHTLMLIPQVTNAWNPTTNLTPGTQTTGSYFLVKCRIWDTNVELWPNKSGVTTEYIAIPFAADWKAGRKYVYTFVFGNAGGFGGYDPTSGDKVLLPIKLTSDVHEFAEVEVPGTLDN
ncbi:MAG: fimbrillin family protein, partial [Candidatus Limisoma sp.]